MSTLQSSIQDTHAGRKPTYAPRDPQTRRKKDRAFLVLCVATACFAVLMLATLLTSIAADGVGRLGWDFLTSLNSLRDPHEAGIWPALVGSVFLLVICAATAIPIGVGTAILLEEYRPKHPTLRWLHGFVQTNISNLAGVPSIVYGILGFSAFATMFGLFGSMTDPGLTVGQTWFYQYRDVAGNTYYTAAPAEAPEELPGASADMTYYTSVQLDEIADVAVLAAADLAPLQERIEADVDVIAETLKDMLYATRETRRGPVVVPGSVALEIGQAAFADTNLKADTQELLQITVGRLQAMDGKTAREIRTDRRALVDELEAAEMKAAGVDGQIIAGSTPQRRDVREPWYVQFPFGTSVLAGGLTLMLVILPIIIVASQEAIRSVPQSMRHGSLALGGTKWQAIQQVVLPAAVPGICTGSILAMSRAIGEAAPILLLGAGFVSFTPVLREGGNLMDGFSAMPLQIYNWTKDPDAAFKQTAAAGIIVLLTVLLSFNAIAVFIRQKYTQKI